MNYEYKILLISTLLATLSSNGFQAHATAPNTLPPPRVPGLEQVILKKTTQLVSITPVSVELNDGLIAHYPFSGNAEDNSGNQNHLKVNGAVLTEDRFGMTDSAYSLTEKMITSLQTLMTEKVILLFLCGLRQMMSNKVVIGR